MTDYVKLIWLLFFLYKELMKNTVSKIFFYGKSSVFFRYFSCLHCHYTPFSKCLVHFHKTFKKIIYWLSQVCSLSLWLLTKKYCCRSHVLICKLFVSWQVVYVLETSHTIKDLHLFLLSSESKNKNLFFETEEDFIMCLKCHPYKRITLPNLQKTYKSFYIFSLWQHSKVNVVVFWLSSESTVRIRIWENA